QTNADELAADVRRGQQAVDAFADGGDPEEGAHAALAPARDEHAPAERVEKDRQRMQRHEPQQHPAGARERDEDGAALPDDERNQQREAGCERDAHRDPHAARRASWRMAARRRKPPVAAPQAAIAARTLGLTSAASSSA